MSAAAVVAASASPTSPAAVPPVAPAAAADASDDGFPKHLMCFVCLELPLGRVEQCANGHIMCAGGHDSCLAKLRRHKRAPKCFCDCPLTPVGPGRYCSPCHQTHSSEPY